MSDSEELLGAISLVRPPRHMKTARVPFTPLPYASHLRLLRPAPAWPQKLLGRTKDKELRVVEWYSFNNGLGTDQFFFSFGVKDKTQRLVFALYCWAVIIFFMRVKIVRAKHCFTIHKVTTHFVSLQVRTRNLNPVPHIWWRVCSTRCTTTKP